MGWGLNQLNSTGHVTLTASMTKKARKARAYKYSLSLIVIHAPFKAVYNITIALRTLRTLDISDPRQFGTSAKVSVGHFGPFQKC